MDYTEDCSSSPSNNIGDWVVIEMVNGEIIQALNYCGRPKDEALNCAVELAKENGYEHGNSDARDILNSYGVLFIGDYAVHVVAIT